MQSVREIDVDRLNKLGPPRAVGVKRAYDYEIAAELREAGYSWNQVAEYFGVCRATVRNRRKEAPAADNRTSPSGAWGKEERARG